MKTPQPNEPDNTNNRAAATASGAASEETQNVVPQTETEKESDSFLDRETYGQVTDDNNTSGQRMADMMDDSLRSDEQAPDGPSPASADNLPDELTHARDANFTLPEMQHQGKNLTAESDPEE
jgi:hypothetical protein